MGNLLQRGLVHRHGRRIKIMKADGTVIKLRNCPDVSVSEKEVLIDYPNHEIFEAAPAGSPIGRATFSRLPLPERPALVAGHLYYLMPLPLPLPLPPPQGELMERGSSSVHISNIPSAMSSWSRPLSSAGIRSTDSMKKEADDHAEVNKINRGVVTIVSSSYSADGSSIRVKLRLRKEDLASFLSANSDNVQVIGDPLIQAGVTRQSALSPWKPSLDTIAEPDSPHGDS